MASLQSAGKTYTATNTGTSDAGGVELTDGVLSSGNHTDTTLVYVGSNVGTVLIIDLGANYALSYARFHYYRVDIYGVGAPSGITIYGSTDNTNRDSLGSFSNGTNWSVADTTNGWSGNLSIAGTYRYIKFTTTNSLEWFTPSEFEVYGDVAAAGPANLKTINGLAKASVKTINGLAIASVKTRNGLG